jgi:hypothetical protein
MRLMRGGQPKGKLRSKQPEVKYTFIHLQEEREDEETNF